MPASAEVSTLLPASAEVPTLLPANISKSDVKRINPRQNIVKSKPAK